MVAVIGLLVSGFMYVSRTVTALLGVEAAPPGKSIVSSYTSSTSIFCMSGMFPLLAMQVMKRVRGTLACYTGCSIAQLRPH